VAVLPSDLSDGLWLPLSEKAILLKRSEGRVIRFDFNSLAGVQAAGTGHETGQADWQSAAGWRPSPHFLRLDHSRFSPLSVGKSWVHSLFPI
jgi:hypothetical protein